MGTPPTLSAICRLSLGTTSTSPDCTRRRKVTGPFTAREAAPFFPVARALGSSPNALSSKPPHLERSH